MKVDQRRVLSVTVRSGRMGAVLMAGPEILYWAGSEQAVRSSKQAKQKLVSWLNIWKPDILITENPDLAGRKTGRQLAIIKALSDVGTDRGIEQRLVTRFCPFANQYEEAADLAKRFPILAHILPQKPKLWEKEPYSLVFFEALVLVRESGVVTEPFKET